MLNLVFKTRFHDLNTSTTNNYHTQLDINSVRELTAVIRENIFFHIIIGKTISSVGQMINIFAETIPMHF